MEFPEEMIQHIQCFLSAKEAARSSILSKSWHTAWLTRPNLDFFDRDFRVTRLDNLRSPSERAFVKLTKTTMQRYVQLNRKISSFRLRMHNSSLKDYTLYKISLANELTSKAIKLGATHIHVELEWNSVFLLPDEVLQSHTLLRLSIMYCKIHLKDRSQVRFSTLQSLTLRRVRIESGNIIWDVISMCPLIEELVLSECKSSDAINSPSYRLLPLNDEFHKLKVLSLNEVEIGEWLFHNMSSRFPNLKDLTLHNCFGYQHIQICSNSLEYISLTHWAEKMFRARFDVPQICKFKFLTSYVPSLSFTTISREWEADISFWCKIHNSSWFLELRDFLMELSSSKISLYLNIGISLELEGLGDIIIILDLPKPKPLTVEKLTLLLHAPSSVHSKFLEGVFWICVPSFIIVYRQSSSCLLQRQASVDFINLLCSTLMSENRNKSISFLRHLEEVNLEFFDMNGFEGWQPLQCNTLSDALAYRRYTEIQVCFKLRWGNTS